MTASAAAERRFRVVGFWRRLAAGVVDGLCALPVALGVVVAVASAGGRPLNGLGELGPNYLVELGLDGGAAGKAALWLGATVIYLYFALFHALRGQTPGERLLGMRVIDVWGERPSVLRALGRTLGLMVSLAGALLGVLWIGFDREKRALHDWLAGTYVVATRRREAPAASTTEPVAAEGART